MCEEENEEVKLNDGYFHEAMDRMWILTETFRVHVLEAPAVHQTKELRERAEQVFDAMQNMYQVIGGFELKKVIEDPFRSEKSSRINEGK